MKLFSEGLRGRPSGITFYVLLQDWSDSGRCLHSSRPVLITIFPATSTAEFRRLYQQSGRYLPTIKTGRGSSMQEKYEESLQLLEKDCICFLHQQ